MKKTFEDLLKDVQDPTIKKYTLEGWAFDKVQAEAFANALHGCTITDLNIVANLRNDALAIVAKALPSTAVKKLTLSYNQISDAGLVSLAAVLPFTSIEELDIQLNAIGAIGAKALAEVLPYSSIKKLDISNNLICDKGLEALAKALPASPLTELRSGANRITSEGVLTFAQWVDRSSLRHASFGMNDINDAAKQVLATALQNSAVTECGFWGHRFSSDELIRNSPDLTNESRVRELHSMMRTKAKITPEILPDLIRLYPSLEKMHHDAQSLVLKAADAAQAGGLDMARLIIRALPLNQALSWLEDRGIHLMAKDFLNDDGSVPQDRFMCLGGVKALFAAVESWESRKQVLTALNSIPEAQRRYIPNAHALLTHVSKKEQSAERTR